MDCTVIKIDHLYTLNLSVGAPAILAASLLNNGDLLSYESSAVVLMDAAGEDATFVGISGGKTLTSDTTSKVIPVFPRCIVDIDVVSATYAIGAGVKYSAKNVLVADGGANTIAWIFDQDTATRTRAKVLIDVPALAAVVTAGKLFGPNLA